MMNDMNIILTFFHVSYLVTSINKFQLLHVCVMCTWDGNICLLHMVPIVLQTAISLNSKITLFNVCINDKHLILIWNGNGVNVWIMYSGSIILFQKELDHTIWFNLIVFHNFIQSEWIGQTNRCITYVCTVHVHQRGSILLQFF